MKELKQLREIIIKEIPSIMDLKFGCEALGESGKKFKLKQTAEKTEERGNITLYHYIDSPITLFIKEIIGRPITLADCLRVMNKKDAYGIGGDGRFLLGADWIGSPFAQSWNLKEDLDKQSPETIKFLLELLK